MDIDETFEVHNAILDITINDNRIKDKLKGLINCIRSDISIAEDTSMAIQSIEQLEKFLNLQDYKYIGIDFGGKEVF